MPHQVATDKAIRKKQIAINNKIREENKMWDKSKNYARNRAQLAKRYGNILGSRKSRKSKGCYIATAVYGSYDCPEVWTLRRYRDYTLESTWYGRLFIRLYYAVSPTLVKMFGNKKAFTSISKPLLDRKVAKLIKDGISSLPYND